MRKMTVRLLLLAATAAAGLLFVSSGAAAQDEGGQLYTAYNIWYEQPQKVWSTGYQKGRLLPAGTAVKDVKKTKKNFSFTDPSTDVRYTIVFYRSHHPEKTIDDIYDRFFTDKTFEELTEGFTKEEVEAIKAGKLVNGMSKEAVLVDFGYPPEIATPSLKLNGWQYWRNRFVSFAVEFDENDKVTSADE